MAFRAITATIEMRTPLHVGTGESTETADDLVYRDARGRLCIPGSALAGPLRSIATRLAARFEGEEPCQALTGLKASKACGCLACRLFGDVNPQEDDQTGSASWVLVYDAKPTGTPGIQIRDGVGIDRATGTAARRERIKFDLEVLQARAQFQLRLELDPRLQEDKAMQLLAATLAEWQAGRGSIGGRVSRGLGALKIIEDVQFIQQDLDRKDTLMGFLREGPPWEAQDGDTSWVQTRANAARARIRAWSGAPGIPVARAWALAEFTLAATGPFLTHDLVQAGRSGFDHAPVLVAYEKGARPILPGSSLRGVLRSHAERIARTLKTMESVKKGSKEGVDAGAHFQEHCPACNPLTAQSTDPVASCSSFIRTLSQKERRELDKKGATDKLCLACRLFGSTWHGSRLRVEDAPLQKDTKAEYKVMDFLAIDRFTGGGLEGAKFDAAALWKPRFSVRLFLENPEPWELGWLALVLRDLDQGRTSVGFGRAKGFGRCTIEEPEFTLGILHDTDLPVPRTKDAKRAAQLAAASERLCQTKGTPSGVYQIVVYDPDNKADWLALTQEWVHAFNDQVAGHERPDGFTLSADSYFTEQSGLWLPDLYPVRVS